MKDNGASDLLELATDISASAPLELMATFGASLLTGDFVFAAPLELVVGFEVFAVGERAAAVLDRVDGLLGPEDVDAPAA